MGARLLVLVSGQTLQLTGMTNANGATVVVYSDSAMTTPVTLPYTLTTDTSVWLEDGPVTVTVSQPDGTVIYSDVVRLSSARHREITPLPSIAQVAADVSTGARAPDVQVFASSGSYVVPVGAKVIMWKLIGSGGSGGSGRKGAAGTVRCGGGGGGGAGITDGFALPSSLTSPVSVTVGGSVAGGVSQTVNSTNGVNGVGGVSTTFGSYGRAWGGNGGGGGSTTAAGGGAGQSGARIGGNGGSSSGAGGVGGSAGSGSGSRGGASGGGVTSADVASNGGATSTTGPPIFADGAAGAVDSTLPTSGSALPAGVYESAGSPGGGAGSITTNAQNGADAVGYGVGGAGGGAALDSVGNSGAGGASAPGVAVLIALF